MKPIIRFYILWVLRLGIPFALITWILDLIQGQQFYAWEFIFSALFFGGVTSFIAYCAHQDRLDRLGIQKMSAEHLTAKQSRSITADLSKSELITILKTDPLFGKMNMIETEHGLHLRTKVSWESWGEKIQINVHSENEELNTFQVDSRSKIAFPQIDYGRNLEHVIRLERLITSAA